MNKPEIFEVLGEEFEAEYFPNLYRIFQNNPKWLEEQLKSIADAWHEGSIVSAAQALESDSAHG